MTISHQLNMRNEVKVLCHIKNQIPLTPSEVMFFLVICPRITYRVAYVTNMSINLASSIQCIQSFNEFKVTFFEAML